MTTCNNTYKIKWGERIIEEYWFDKDQFLISFYTFPLFLGSNKESQKVVQEKKKKQSPASYQILKESKRTGKKRRELVRMITKYQFANIIALTNSPKMIFTPATK